MLFILTGAVQIGKTRWLQALVRDLAAVGVTSYGVVAPGVWRLPPSGVAADTSPEKLGIDNVLLPQGERLHFARRHDLAKQEGRFNAASQSARAGLKWEIDDAAIAAVNAHFAALDTEPPRGGEGLRVDPLDACAPLSAATLPQPGLLVVDELGRLEILRDQGLTQAVALLDRGPTPLAPHALIIVRDWLFEDAHARFSVCWPEIRRIAPNDDARKEIFALFQH
ncbi:MAG: hypothetical protein RR794_01470 [Raoultibacter sp.]